MPISPLDFSAHVRAYQLHAGTREIMARTWAAIEASRRLLQEPVVPLQFLPPSKGQAKSGRWVTSSADS